MLCCQWTIHSTIVLRFSCKLKHLLWQRPTMRDLLWRLWLLDDMRVYGGSWRHFRNVLLSFGKLRTPGQPSVWKIRSGILSLALKRMHVWRIGANFFVPECKFAWTMVLFQNAVLTCDFSMFANFIIKDDMKNCMKKFSQFVSHNVLKNSLCFHCWVWTMRTLNFIVKKYLKIIIVS